ncbi:MAG TPA: undecaprenyl-diphosphate phosphatase [Polyangiaceae bacterium]
MPLPTPPGEAAVLGALQGFTELFPVSSDGHLALAELLAGRAEPAAVAFAQGGTLAGILFLMRRRLLDAVVEGARSLTLPSLLQETPAGRDAAFLLVGGLPAAGLNLAMALGGGAGADKGCSLFVIGGCFLGLAATLGTTGLARGTRATPSWSGAFLVGMALGVGALPGLSRVGLAATTLAWLGVAREKMFELALLALVPGLFAACAVNAQACQGAHLNELGVASLAGVLAFGATLVAMPMARALVERGKLALAFVYLVPLAIATLAWGYARP